MEKEDFNYKRTAHLTQKYIDKLKSTDTDYMGVNNEKYNQVSDLEIIPYDQLWEIILFKLQEAEMKERLIAV